MMLPRHAARPRCPSLLGQFLVAILILASLVPAVAAPQVDNNAGTWTDHFRDGVGTGSSNNVANNVFAGIMLLAAGQASGDHTTVEINPPSFDAWDQVCVTATYSAAADLQIEVLDGGTDPTVPGFGPVAIPAGGCIDISSIDVVTHPTLKVKLYHTRGATAPVVRQLQVSWNPLSVLLFDKIGPDEVQAGAIFSYQLRVSANFVQAENVVIWDTLPDLGRGTVTYEAGEDYGQDDGPVVDQISHDGIYTATAITVDGQNIPANSIYWQFASIPEGQTLVLQAFVHSPNGTLDGTEYENNADAHLDNGADQVATPVTTTVRSTPAPNLVKADPTLRRGTQSNIFGPISGTNYASAGQRPDLLPSATRSVPRTATTTPRRGRERMYNTVLWDTLLPLLDPDGDSDFSDSYIELDPMGNGTPVFDISGSGSYTATGTTVGLTTVPANAVYWDLGTFEPGATFSESFSVRLKAGVPAGTVMENTAFLDSDQTGELSDALPWEGRHAAAARHLLQVRLLPPPIPATSRT